MIAADSIGMKPVMSVPPPVFRRVLLQDGIHSERELKMPAGLLMWRDGREPNGKAEAGNIPGRRSAQGRDQEGGRANVLHHMFQAQGY